MDSLPNQRKCTRVPIGYRVKVMAEESTLCPSAINISLNGILLHTTERLPLGTWCYIVIFVLEDGTEAKILAWGIVVRDNADGLAIRFSQILGDDGRERLKSLVLLRCQDPEQAKREFESFVRQGG